MGYVMFFILYVGLSLFIGFIGKNRKFGFWGFFFSSLLLSPIAALLAYFASCEKIRLIVKDEKSA